MGSSPISPTKEWIVVSASAEGGLANDRPLLPPPPPVLLTAFEYVVILAIILLIL